MRGAFVQDGSWIAIDRPLSTRPVDEERGDWQTGDRALADRYRNRTLRRLGGFLAHKIEEIRQFVQRFVLAPS